MGPNFMEKQQNWDIFQNIFFSDQIYSNYIITTLNCS